MEKSTFLGKILLPVLLLFSSWSSQPSGNLVSFRSVNKSFNFYLGESTLVDIFKILGPTTIRTDIIAVPLELSYPQKYVKEETVRYEELGLELKLCTENEKSDTTILGEESYLWSIELDSTSELCMENYCIGMSKDLITSRIGSGKIPSWAKDSSTFYYPSLGLSFDAKNIEGRYFIVNIWKNNGRPLGD